MNREDFPMLNQDIIYFDNGATSFKPISVIDSMTNYYQDYCANCHRGDYDISYKVDSLQVFLFLLLIILLLAAPCARFCCSFLH